jgi:deoxyribonuclease-4
MLQIGLKMWSVNTDIFPQALDAIRSGIFQFIELTPIPGTDITPYVNADVNYLIHIPPPDKYGMNLADSSKSDANLQLLDWCSQCADLLHATHIILHTGHGFREAVDNFLQEISDSRIVLENMTRYDTNRGDMVGYLPEEVAELLGGKFGFCLDVSHAIKTALILGKDYWEFLDDFLPLNPKVIHLSDAPLTNDVDEHLNIGAGDYDWPRLLGYVQRCQNSLITLETPRQAGTLEPNIAEADYLRSLDSLA